MLIDIHVHNEGNPGAMFEHAKAQGMDGLAFAGSPDFADVDAVRAAGAAAGLTALCGCSVATNRGVLLCFIPDLESARSAGNWLGVDADKLPAATDVITAVEALGGVVIAAHPYYKQVPAPMGDHIFSLQGLHACEVASPLTTGMQRDLAIEASETLQLTCVGGSAARTEEHVGMAATYFPEPVASEADLVRQIRERRCFAVMSLEHLPTDARPSQPARPRPPQRNRRRGRRPPPRREPQE
ncbi:MAG: PHP-associated domain-containing protein [Pseudomonadota bacterium]